VNAQEAADILGVNRRRHGDLRESDFPFFTQSDIEVGDNYLKRYIPIFQPLTVQMMMADRGRWGCEEHAEICYRSVPAAFT
jgi:hypothetical protein